MILLHVLRTREQERLIDRTSSTIHSSRHTHRRHRNFNIIATKHWLRDLVQSEFRQHKVGESMERSQTRHQVKVQVIAKTLNSILSVRIKTLKQLVRSHIHWMHLQSPRSQNLG